MSPLPYRAVDALPAIGLAELDATAALRDRVDVKYVVPAAAFAALATRLAATHAVLEIDGRRTFRYHSTYFDTADLEAFRDHLRERRQRFKCRSRVYVDSGACAFEVKLKGSRGRTVKHRIDHDRPDQLTPSALAFLRDRLREAYGREPAGPLRPALTVAYTRITLSAPALGERLTCDFDLEFGGPDGTGGRLLDGSVILESKSRRGNATADRALRALGARPERGCSKYCIGISLTRPGVTRNPLLPLLRRHFQAA